MSSSVFSVMLKERSDLKKIAKSTDSRGLLGAAD
jgi:hypothetical protein